MNEFEINPIIKTAKYAIDTLEFMVIPPNPVIIFDIDSTLINSISGECKYPIIILYNYALKRGIIPIIITARIGTQDIINYTKTQLSNCGIIGYNFIYFRTIENNDIWNYKEEARRNVVERGYNILMSVGDMEWDIYGKYTGVPILVPKDD